MTTSNIIIGVAGGIVTLLIILYVDHWVNKRQRSGYQTPLLPPRPFPGTASISDIDRFMLEIDSDLRSIQYALKGSEESRRVFALRDKIQLEYAKIKGEVPRS